VRGPLAESLRRVGAQVGRQRAVLLEPDRKILQAVNGQRSQIRQNGLGRVVGMGWILRRFGEQAGKGHEPLAVGADSLAGVAERLQEVGVGLLEGRGERGRRRLPGIWLGG